MQQPDNRWFGHPRGLATLFYTEMWERLSYYGMRALLVLFLVEQSVDGGLGMSDATATAVYGLYTFAVYALALPGGWIADRLIGQRRAVLYGGIVIATGHFLLAVPALAAFYAGLGLIVIGTGLLKPAVSAMVGDLYQNDDARRDAGFSTFYAGINIGAFLGPIVCGYLGQEVNWHLGFGAAGVGMVAGVVQYARGLRHLGDAGRLRVREAGERARALRALRRGVAASAALGLVLLALQAVGVLALTTVGLAGATGVLIAVVVGGYFAQLFLRDSLDREERRRVAVIMLLFLAAAVFWSGFEQAGSSLNLFADRLVDRTILGFEWPASWAQSINPAMIVLMAPLFGSLWLALGRRNPSVPVKFALGLSQLGVGFLVLAWGSTFAADGGRVSAMWLVVAYFLHTTGELCLSPVGLSSITKLAPERLVGQMMGIWFMATAFGSLLAGLVAGLIESLPLPQLFGAVGFIAAGAGLVLGLASRPIRRLSGGAG